VDRRPDRRGGHAPGLGGLPHPAGGRLLRLPGAGGAERGGGGEVAAARVRLLGRGRHRLREPKRRGRVHVHPLPPGGPPVPPAAPPGRAGGRRHLRLRGGGGGGHVRLHRRHRPLHPLHPQRGRARGVALRAGRAVDVHLRRGPGRPALEERADLRTAPVQPHHRRDRRGGDGVADRPAVAGDVHRRVRQRGVGAHPAVDGLRGRAPGQLPPGAGHRTAGAGAAGDGAAPAASSGRCCPAWS